VPAARIQSQMNRLNNTYANTPFFFDLVDTDRTTNANWFHMGMGTATERNAKNALRRGGKGALNIYTISDSSLLGWSTFPSDVSNLSDDGVVVHHQSLPGGNFSNFNQGKTATHEIGHWLGLFHTFQGGCAAPGDSVSDTPFQASPTSGCPASRDSCPNDPGVDPIHNYMDYSDDPCMTNFTDDQRVRMDNQHLRWRT